MTRASLRIAIGAATKIGGRASDVQSIRIPEVPSDWRFLAQIVALWPVVDRPYPLVNRAAPVGAFPDEEYASMLWGPGDGVLALYLDGDDEIRIRFSCA